MNALRRIRYAVTLLLIIMALFVGMESAILNVQAANTITLIGPNTANPTTASTGQDVGVSGQLTATSGAITSCTITGSGSVVSGSSCAITAGSGGTTAGYSGSFTVGNVAPGQYLITVTGNAPGALAQATLIVISGPVIFLKPSIGPVGTSVTISGTFFQPTDTSCTISSPSSGTVIASGSAGCSTFSVPVSSSNSSYLEMNVTGSFVIGNVPSGQYVIQVRGSAGDFAQAVLNVTSGPFIQLGVNGIFAGVGRVAGGVTGTHVSIEGSSFTERDTSCTLYSPSNGAIIVNGACSTFTNSITGFQNVTGSFVIGNVGEGQYVIQVTGNTGDFAQAVLNVTAGAFIQLGVNGIFAGVGRVAGGVTGTHVSIEGSNFLPGDANSGTCTISSPSSGTVIASGSAACSFFKASNGFANVTGSFVVGNVAEGQYVIQVSGSAGDRAQAVFNVTAGAFIQLGTNGN
ncbi:MAG: hypothetical protein ABSA92_15185, partial [Candidatus Bathyarchaeia archaeon]